MLRFLSAFTNFHFWCNLALLRAYEQTLWTLCCIPYSSSHWFCKTSPYMTSILDLSLKHLIHFSYPMLEDRLIISGFCSEFSFFFVLIMVACSYTTINVVSIVILCVAYQQLRLHSLLICMVVNFGLQWFSTYFIHVCWQAFLLFCFFFWAGGLFFAISIFSRVSHVFWEV